MIRNTKSGDGAKARLQQRLLKISFFNLLLVALLGVLLRSFPFLDTFPLLYKNVLHGHSHFAFAGWIMPVLLSVAMKSFPELCKSIRYRHWRNIAALVLLSAYGMLIAFPLQGYKAVSISFSTLSVIATVYWALQVWKATEHQPQTTSALFLKWGLLYGCLSAVGPFATGPLSALGYGNSPLYFDAIYFYLHFQYNGLFSFVVLALLYRRMERLGCHGIGKKAFTFFNAACLPAYVLSVLWSKPSIFFNLIGGVAAVLQLAGLWHLGKDVTIARLTKSAFLLRLSLVALVMKFVLQLLSAFPVIAALAAENRNFVIAYLHLVLLGFISLAVFGLAVKDNRCTRIGLLLFLISFVATEVLLVLNASSSFLLFSVPYFVQLLWFFSLFFPIGIAFILTGLNTKQSGRKRNRRIVTGTSVLRLLHPEKV